MLEPDASPAFALRQARGSERIAAAMRDVPFPVTKEELIARLADVVLEVDRDVVQPLPDLLRGLPQTRFSDAGQARRAADARWARIHECLAAVERAEREAP